MIRQATGSWVMAACLGACALVPFAVTACTGDAGDAIRDDSTSRTEGALSVTRPGGPGPTSTVIGPGGGWAPIPVYAATLFGAGTTSNTVTMSWKEHGGNGQTLLYRQLYDLAGNPTGVPQLIRSFQSLAAGTVTVTDTNQVLTKSLAVVPGGAGIPAPVGLIQPDHQIGYEVVEIASGYSDCQSLPGGSTCARTSMTAYTQSAVPYGAGRAQLRIKVAATTANPGSLHVRAELSPWNITWLDSTKANFSLGSNTTYDLVTDWIDKRSDIQYLDLWTPDAEGICVSEVQLVIDNTTTFHQSFATCQWVKNGSELMVPFAALRSSAEWQHYTPQIFPPSDATAPITFVGFDSAGLISYLDAAVGTQLKNPIPTPADGFDARLGAPTTISRTDSRHLHVQQHLVNLHATWDNIDLGNVNANPSYDLVIHHADATCADWCLKVENPSAGASYSDGLTEWLLGIFTLGVAPIVEHGANGKLEDALAKFTHGLPDPQAFGYCFVPTTVDPANPASVFPTFSADGTARPFDVGSLTICSH